MFGAWRAPTIMSAPITRPAPPVTRDRGQLAYRPDIDGLRAVAVTSVLLYHAYPTLLPGGFVGVDVFFVISGFLITSLILAQLQDGSFTPLGFYRRRVRRLVPALLTLLAVCALVGLLVMTPLELSWFGRSLAWSAPFLGHAFLAGSQGYFDNVSHLNALKHLWSLGVEEQFYLLWPLLLMLCVRHGVTRAVVLAVLLSSFLICIRHALDAPGSSFYLLSSRMWELAAGALIASYGIRAQRPVANVFAVSGIVLIAASAAVLTGEWPFPGWWAAVPVVGALGVIAAGPTALLNRAVLASPPFVFVGRISYSLYLWHWPVLAFTQIVHGPQLSPVLATGCLAVATALACVSYYFVETPARRGLDLRKSMAALLAGLAVMTLIGVALDSGRLNGRLRGPAVDAVDFARNDRTYPLDFMRTGDFGALPVPGPGRKKVVLIGDSHIEHYWPRVVRVLHDHPDAPRSAEFVTFAGCPPLPGINSAEHPVAACNRFFDYAMEHAFQKNVDTVVFGAFWEKYFLGEFGFGAVRRPMYAVVDPLHAPVRFDSPRMAAALAGFEAAVSRLTASGRSVYIVLSNPTSPTFVPASSIPVQVRVGLETLAEMPAYAAPLRVADFRAFVAPVIRVLEGIATRTGAKLLDPSESLCHAGLCPAMAEDGRLLYTDSSHVRPFFSRESAWFIDGVVLAPGGDPRQGEP